MIVQGKECFYNPDRHELTMIFEDYGFGSVATQISLKKRKKETFDELEILFLVYRCSAALRFSHFQEIFHGDIKP